MGLASENIEEILCCPNCRADLFFSEHRTKCSNGKCPLSENPFERINGKLALIDHKNSIISERQLLNNRGKSTCQRKKNFLKTWMQNNLFRPEAISISSSNASKLLKIIKKKNNNPRILVVGGGTKGNGTESFYLDPDVDVISFDVYVSDLTHFIADAHKMPIKSGTIDVVWIQYVLEHVLDPGEVVSEVFRVVKHEGLVYAETPFLQQVHEGAYDFTRFTHSGHRWLFRKFEEIESGVVMGPGVQLLWTIEHIGRGVFRSKILGKIIKLMFFWVRFIEKFIGDMYKVDAASAVYFMGKKTGKIMDRKELVVYYKGADK